MLVMVLVAHKKGQTSGRIPIVFAGSVREGTGARSEGSGPEHL